MNTLGKNYLAALVLFALVLGVFLYERSASLEGLAQSQGVTHPQPQEAAVAAPAPAATIDNLTPPPATLTPPAPTAPSIDLSPRAGEGS